MIVVAAEAEEPAVVGRLAEPSTAAIGVLSGLKAVQKRFAMISACSRVVVPDGARMVVSVLVSVMPLMTE